MPPKAKSAERVKQEAEAQRARVAALQYLAKTGDGPSQKEIAQQQKDREKWTNATSQSIQQKLAHLLPSAQSGQGNAPMRDNTLEAMAAQRARLVYQTQGGGDAAFRSAYASAVTSTSGQNGFNGRIANSSADAGSNSALPSGWKEARDPSSGDTYYYNEVTKETSWDRPQTQPDAVADAKDAAGDDDEALEDGWEEVQDPDSGATYYWNRTTNDTTWTKPVKKTVSLEEAREAKSRLDAILKICGPATQSKPPAKQTAAAKASGNSQQALKPANHANAATLNYESNGGSSKASNEPRKRGHADDDEASNATKMRRTDATN